MGDPRARRVGPIGTEHLFDLVAELDESIDFGRGPVGRRRFDRVRRGTFAGPRLRGEVLTGGGDWGLFGADGVMAIDARVTLRTNDGALIHMSYNGRLVVPDEVVPQITDLKHRHEIDPKDYYFRIAPLFETGAADYRWLNGIVSIGYGYLIEDGGVGYEVSAIT